MSTSYGSGSVTASTVFVVDDDVMVCKALERLLRSAGHEVETFTSAEAFLAREPVAKSGALLVDVCMPWTTGPELQARLVAGGSTLSVFFMSALEDAETRERVLRLGARRWFQKPLDVEALLTALDEARDASCTKVQ